MPYCTLAHKSEDKMLTGLEITLILKLLDLHATLRALDTTPHHTDDDTNNHLKEKLLDLLVTAD